MDESMLSTDNMHSDIIIEVGMGVDDVHPMTCAFTTMRERIHQECPVGTRGTTVKFTLLGPFRKLVVCQVEIYGHPGKHNYTYTQVLMLAITDTGA